LSVTLSCVSETVANSRAKARAENRAGRRRLWKSELRNRSERPLTQLEIAPASAAQTLSLCCCRPWGYRRAAPFLAMAFRFDSGPWPRFAAITFPPFAPSARMWADSCSANGMTGGTMPSPCQGAWAASTVAMCSANSFARVFGFKDGRLVLATALRIGAGNVPSSSLGLRFSAFVVLLRVAFFTGFGIPHGHMKRPIFTVHIKIPPRDGTRYKRGRID